MSEIITTDVLVIGAGLAGERAAISAAAEGNEVVILSLVPPRRSHSCAAQGGMQAALGNCAKGEGDSEELHWLDTVKGSDWGCDQEVARIFADTAPIAMREMAHHGVPWTRVKGGPADYFIKGKKVTLEEPHDKEGLIMHRDFGGVSRWRTCYTADGTGHTVLYTMDNMVVQLGITVHDRMEAISLIHDGTRCHGAVVRCLRTGTLKSYLSKATVIATGGFGRVYKYSTNAIINQGTGQSIALDTGIVPMGNMEAVQFHPTGIVPTDILVTEGCRGDGGLLLDVDEYRFMPDYEPEKQELASRDVVSRRMAEHIQKGKGVPSPDGDHLWLDLRHLGEQHLRTKLREVYDICMYFLGVNPIKELVPVRPTQHYSMGGIRVNKDGHAYGLEGLWSVGESACWDMHGMNRLGGNSLAETVVAGMFCGQRMGQWASQQEPVLDAKLAAEAEAEQQERIDNLLGDGLGQANENADELLNIMQETLQDKVGIFRKGDQLAEAVDTLRELYQRTQNLKLRSSTRGVNPEVALALRLPGMIKLGLCVAKGALLRTESRGGHSREDYPERNDKDWLNRTLARWPEGATEPDISYEPVGLLESPPGHRGYGGATNIPMEQSVQEYNDNVKQEWIKQGWHETATPIGAELKEMVEYASTKES
ncbi:MAG: fumarate reductase flavoprotein subunit [Verrucomicrobiales bacterium]|jgi:fumarate reductase flavoprotein subunit|nr:fumarate reductase flavoprotein subunit [Verrucomicrobiales bacterium]MDP6678923.1 fumarate reductase flavoprotein subunit [Verrucomicrobiota bacterium]